MSAIMKQARKKVLVAIPTHKGDVAKDTLMSAVAATSARDLEIGVHISGFSLLANNFNRLFCYAYKNGYDYFVMLHSDLGVEGILGQGSWVDLLVTKTDLLDVAALSVAVPIKGSDGLTSLAINPDPSNKYTIRRVTMAELGKLPQDFISRLDVCQVMGLDPAVAGALLINTGCLCMPLRSEKYSWCKARWPGFQIEDFLAWNKSGVPQAYVTPEDWNFSRWLYTKGWSYYATNEIVATHFGGCDWKNRGVWGHEIDVFGFQVPIADYEVSE